MVAIHILGRDPEDLLVGGQFPVMVAVGIEPIGQGADEVEGIVTGLIKEKTPLWERWFQ
jgi:hypothetical protein